MAIRHGKEFPILGWGFCPPPRRWWSATRGTDRSAPNPADGCRSRAPPRYAPPPPLCYHHGGCFSPKMAPWPGMMGLSNCVTALHSTSQTVCSPICHCLEVSSHRQGRDAISHPYWCLSDLSDFLTPSPYMALPANSQICILVGNIPFIDDHVKYPMEAMSVHICTVTKQQHTTMYCS